MKEFITLFQEGNYKAAKEVLKEGLSAKAIEEINSMRESVAENYINVPEIDDEDSEEDDS